jgi:hypothetical protein
LALYVIELKKEIEDLKNTRIDYESKYFFSYLATNIKINNMKTDRNILRKSATILALIISVLIISCNKEPVTIVETGTTDNLTWTFTDDGTLTISGTGAMNEGVSEYPWSRYRDAVRTVVIEDGVTSIGSGTFAHYSGLTKVIIGKSVTSFGSYASSFSDCTNLTAVYFNAVNCPALGRTGSIPCIFRI